MQHSIRAEDAQPARVWRRLMGGEGLTDDPLLRIPADLPGNEEHPSPGRRQDSIRIATRQAELPRVDRLQAGCTGVMAHV